MELGKFMLETKLSPSVSSAGLGFRRPAAAQARGASRLNHTSRSPSLGRGAKLASGPGPAAAFDAGAARGHETQEPARTPAQVRPRQRC